MSTTLTTIVKPAALVPGLKIAVYQIELDTSFPAGGEAIDLTADFDYIYAMIPGGNDTVTDNGYMWGSIIPTPTTAVATANVLVDCHWAAGLTTAAHVFAPFTTTGNLSAIGQLTLVVIGA